MKIYYTDHKDMFPETISVYALYRQLMKELEETIKENSKDIDFGDEEHQEEVTSQAKDFMKSNPDIIEEAEKEFFKSDKGEEVFNKIAYEYYEVKNKVQKLENALFNYYNNRPNKLNISSNQAKLMTKQLEYMKGYRDILKERILDMINL